MPHRGGPYPHLRLSLAVKLQQGQAVIDLMRNGMSLRAAARMLGIPVTTAWRRYWVVMDYTVSLAQGGPPAGVPVQRGTSARPRG